MKKQTATSGLSLVEVLVAMTLMTVLITVIASPLAGLFKISKESKEVLAANSDARSALETARASWQTYPWSSLDDPNADENNDRVKALNEASLRRYNKNCFGPEIQSHQKDNITFTIHQLDRNNEVADDLDSSKIAYDCDDLSEGPKMIAKRIVVHVTDSEGNTTILTHVDVRPPTTSKPGS